MITPFRYLLESHISISTPIKKKPQGAIKGVLSFIEANNRLKNFFCSNRLTNVSIGIGLAQETINHMVVESKDFQGKESMTRASLFMIVYLLYIRRFLREIKKRFYAF